MPTATASRTALHVASIGPALPPGAHLLRALGIHRAAINLGLGGRSIVISIVGPSNAGEPASIALDADRDFRSWPTGEVTTGYIDQSRLELRDSLGALRVELDLGEAPRLEATEMPEIARLGRAWALALSELADIQARKSTELRIGALVDAARGPGLATSPLARAILALAKTPLTASLDLLKGIVGLGPGLTPAGDDFLVGFAGAAACARRGRESGTLPTPPPALAAALHEAASSTTEFSASMLRLAAKGYFSASLGSLAAALARDDAAAAVRALRRLCAIGHSSGADTATGFLYGLEPLCGPGAEDIGSPDDSDKDRRRQHAP